MPELNLTTTEERLKTIIEDAVEEKTRAGLPVCALEGVRMAQVEKQVEANRKLLTGNGDPEKGLVMKVDRIEATTTAIKADIKAIKNAAWVFASAVLLGVLGAILRLVIIS